MKTSKALYICVAFMAASTISLFGYEDTLSLPVMSPRLTRGFGEILLPAQDNDPERETKGESIQQDSKEETRTGSQTSPTQRFLTRANISENTDSKLPQKLAEEKIMLKFPAYNYFPEYREGETYLRPLNSITGLNYEYDPENYRMKIKDRFHSEKYSYENVIQVHECIDPEKPSRKLIINRTIEFPYTPFFILSDGSKDYTTEGIERISILQEEDTPEDLYDIFELESESINPETPEPSVPAIIFDITRHNSFAHTPSFIGTVERSNERIEQVD